MSLNSSIPTSTKVERRKTKRNGMDQGSKRQATRDQVADAIKSAVDKFALQSFEHFQAYHNRLHVHPTVCSHPITGQDGNWLGYDRYTFDLYGQEAKDMDVHFDRRGNIYVFYARDWIHLANFLPKLPLPVNMWGQSEKQQSADKVRLWQDQWNWWQKTGKKFRLLDLPVEIREVVYSFAVAGIIQPYPRAPCRGISKSHKQSLADSLPNINLLKICRQVYNEAGHILYRDSSFLVEKRTMLENGLLAKKAMRNHIKKLDLCFSHKDFWKVFGFEAIELGIKWKPKKAAQMLRKMKLTELTLTIPMPQKVSELPWIDKCCQKIAVDWIFESAWPWVKGHPVKLGGGVKIKQQNDFLKKCAGEQQEYLKWSQLKPVGYIEGTLEEYDEWMSEEDGGFPLDGQELVGRGENDGHVSHEKAWPLICTCTLPCWEQWTPAD